MKNCILTIELILIMSLISCRRDKIEKPFIVINIFQTNSAGKDLYYYQDKNGKQEQFIGLARKIKHRRKRGRVYKKDK